VEAPGVVLMRSGRSEAIGGMEVPG
jgi:hypothetical protein